MFDLTCPHCGAAQPDDALSFRCTSCGTDLAGKRAGPKDPELRPGRSRRLGWIGALLLGASSLLMAGRFCVDRTGEEHGRGLATRTLGAIVEPPAPQNQLPAVREVGFADLSVADTAVPIAEGGTIRGRVTWGRVRPPPVYPFLSGDRDCGVTVQIPAVPVGVEGGVAEALVVALPEGAAAPPAERQTSPLRATIRACLAEPRLLAGPPGTPVELRAVGLAAHELVPSAPLSGLPARLESGAVLHTRLPRSGTVHVADPAHPWERISLVALPTALAALVNAEGFFRLANVPPGKVTLRFYTELTGPFDRVVELPPAGDVMLQVDLADELPAYNPPVP